MPHPSIANEQPANNGVSGNLQAANRAERPQAGSLNQNARNALPKPHEPFGTADAFGGQGQPLAQTTRGSRGRSASELADIAASEADQGGVPLPDEMKLDTLENAEAQLAYRDQHGATATRFTDQAVQVVEVNVSAEDLASHFIDQKLREQGIAVELAQVDFDVANLNTKDKQNSIAARGENRQTDKRQKAEEDVLKQLNAQIADVQDSAIEDVDYVYIEATADQIEALLANLKISTEGQKEQGETNQQIAGAFTRTMPEASLVEPTAPKAAAPVRPNEGDGPSDAQQGGAQQGESGFGQGVVDREPSDQFRVPVEPAVRDAVVGEPQVALGASEQRAFARRLAMSKRSRAQVVSKAGTRKGS